ncbi:kinase-like domain-containing protein [Glomus cerebriforme]|uniref:Kinase-like domain-containing protein n=1 Tax=Glomus cerebriforme TaxID=658196 RepID=A0A397SYM3_9GLOM|nr:kinase-like domain-containing protein [Glomus cerebriforme]
MYDKIKLQDDKNPNEWIEEAISKNHIKYYDYKHFTNIEKIGNNSFEKVYRANWKNSEQCFALKSFLNFNNLTVKEILHEFELQRKVDFHNNIIHLYGITAKESLNSQLKKYLLVMEYVYGNSLQNYIKETFENLTWEDKYKLAYQLTCVVSHLHDKGIVHGDLVILLLLLPLIHL